MKRLLFALLSLAAVCGCSSDDDSADKVYEVGDVYFRNGKSGIVFWVTDDGRHGKIVSADYGYCPWSCIKLAYGQAGTFDEDDGMNNMAKIREFQGWHEKFPAFAWCADKGKDWYLPARNELMPLLESGVLYDSVNFWSSTERDREWDEAWIIIAGRNAYSIDCRETPAYYNNCYVRAIAAF